MKVFIERVQKGETFVVRITGSKEADKELGALLFSACIGSEEFRVKLSAILRLAQKACLEEGCSEMDKFEVYYAERSEQPMK